MTTFPLLRITDGTTTVTILDGAGGQTNYSLIRDSWAPSIAQRNPSSYGDLYLDTYETFDINVYGATASAAYNNLATLVRLLDQADRWAQNADQSSLSPVRLEYNPQGSAVSSGAAPYQVTVLGRGPGDNTRNVQVSEGYITSGLNFQIPDVRVQVRRRALWTEFAFDNASSTPQNSGNRWTISTFANHPTPSPISINYNIPIATTYAAGDGPLVGLLAPDSADLHTEAMANGSGTGWSTIATSQSFSGTGYRRYAPGTGAATGTWTFDNTRTITTNLFTPGTYVFVAQGRADSTAWSLGIGVQVAQASGSGSDILRTPLVPVPSRAWMAPIVLGSITISPDMAVQFVNLTATKIATGSASQIDVDFISMIRLSDLARVLVFDALPFMSSASAPQFALFHVSYYSPAVGLAPRPQPSVVYQLRDGGGIPYVQGPWAYRGKLPMYMRGTTISGIWLFGTGTFPIRFPSLTGGTTQITRERAHLFPV